MDLAGRVTGTYETFVSRTSYILAYALSDRTIILHVIRGKRDWPDESRPED